MKNFLFFAFLLIFSSQNVRADEMSYQHGKIQYKSRFGEQVLAPDTALKKLLRNNPDLYVSPERLENTSSILVLVRYASKPQGLGRCGSGTKDYFFLLKIFDSTLQFQDKLSIQSCEKNIYLDILDPYSPDAILNAIHLNKDDLSIHFVIKKYLGSDAFLEDKNYHILKNKFISLGVNQKQNK